VRTGGEIALTIACATVGAELRDLDAYVALKEKIAEMLQETVPDARIRVNAADDVARGSVYLTVTGTSADSGDDGQVGRGNRVNGLITPMRPMSLEAIAGKNPTRHIGKLYNVAATQIARAVVEGVEEVAHAEVVLVGTIGAPIERPTLSMVRLETRDRSPIEPLTARVREIAESQLAALDALSMRVVRGEVRLY
jgi:S-adenosylmethionine synthetase